MIEKDTSNEATQTKKSLFFQKQVKFFGKIAEKYMSPPILQIFSIAHLASFTLPLYGLETTIRFKTD